MTVTKQIVARQLAAHLHHERLLARLVAWAEPALLGGEMPEREPGAISAVIARLGVADRRAFGLTWGDC